MKKILTTILTFILFITNVKAFSNVSAEDIYFENLSRNLLLYEENYQDKISIASLTKITTAIVAIEKISNLDEEFTLTNEDMLGVYDLGVSLAGFDPGDTVTYRDLLYGLLLPSGAECAKSLGSIAFQGEDNLVKAMNDLAQKLKLKNTHYTNPIGLDDDNHYSTLEDVATVLKYALQNPTFYEIFTSRTYEATNGLTLQSTIEYYNKSIGLDLDYIIGSKSGFTLKAGRCLLTIATHNNENYLLIVANSDANSNISHIKDTNTLYQHFFNNYVYKTIIKKDDLIATVKTYNNKEINIKASQDYNYYLDKNTDIKVVFDGLDIIPKETKKGDIIGKLIIYGDGKALITEDIKLDHDLKKSHPVILTILIIFILLFLFREYNIYKRKMRYKRKMKNR